MTRQERIALHKKQERLKVETGVPSAANLSEGIPVLRFTDEGVVEYVRYNGVLYKSVFSKSVPIRAKTKDAIRHKTWDEI